MTSCVLPGCAAAKLYLKECEEPPCCARSNDNDALRRAAIRAQKRAKVNRLLAHEASCAAQQAQVAASGLVSLRSSCLSPPRSRQHLCLVCVFVRRVRENLGMPQPSRFEAARASAHKRQLSLPKLPSVIEDSCIGEEDENDSGRNMTVKVGQKRQRAMTVGDSNGFVANGQTELKPQEVPLTDSRNLLTSGLHKPSTGTGDDQGGSELRDQAGHRHRRSKSPGCDVRHGGKGPGRTGRGVSSESEGT